MVMRNVSCLMIGAALATVAFASAVHAEDRDATPARGGVITADTIHIALRPPRPQVATEIAKIVPQRPLLVLRQPFLDRVEKVIDKAPF